jgi:hypothetical protein
MSISLGNNVTLANVTYKDIGNGVDSWSQLAKSIRIATRQGQLHPPVSASGGTIIDTSNAVSYYLVLLFFISGSWYFNCNSRDYHLLLVDWKLMPMLLRMLLLQVGQT